MTDIDLWFALMAVTACVSAIGLTLSVVALVGAQRTERREDWQHDSRAPLRRMLARLHFLNQRNRAFASLLILLWALNLLRAGPPAMFRPATWQSVGLIALLAVITTLAAGREWRIRIVIRRRAEELDGMLREVQE